MYQIICIPLSVPNHVRNEVIFGSQLPLQCTNYYRTVPITVCTTECTTVSVVYNRTEHFAKQGSPAHWSSSHLSIKYHLSFKYLLHHTDLQPSHLRCIVPYHCEHCTTLVQHGSTLEYNAVPVYSAIHGATVVKHPASRCRAN